MRKVFVGIILTLTMVMSFNMVAFASLVGFEPGSIPICIGIDIQE